MAQDNALDSIVRFPNVTGCVRCSHSGDIHFESGEEITALAHALGDFMEMASGIGESFGLDSLHHVEAQGDSRSTVCVPYPDGAIGVTLSSRAGVSEIVARVKDALVRA